jgi:hypothetical protein
VYEYKNGWNLEGPNNTPLLKVNDGDLGKRDGIGWDEIRVGKSG